MFAALQLFAETPVKVSHYKPKAPENAAQALETFEKGFEKIKVILNSAKSVRGQPLEQVHELTYDLEASVNFWKTEFKDNKNITKLADTLEEVHLGSERQKEEQVRTNFKKLEQLFAQTKSSLTKQ